MHIFFWKCPLVTYGIHDFQYFLLTRSTIVFFEFPLDLPILWHASMSSAVICIFAALLSLLITVDSKLASEILLGIPLIPKLFHLPYYSTELLLNSRQMIFSCKWLTTSSSLLFSFWRFLILTSLRFIIWSLISVNLFFKFSTNSSLSFEIPSNILESLISSKFLYYIHEMRAYLDEKLFQYIKQTIITSIKE